MKLTRTELENKILGCFNGKNIGGVLGAPFEECIRSTHDVTFYVQENINQNPPPNDDLDLQLVWLNAAEKYGSRLNSHILAEYWSSYIVPNWSEYGMGKRNLRAGMLPPLSGSVKNPYKDSNGSWIRSEIWACLAPAHPEIAVRYAIEDAIIDHADEGLYANVYTAAMQSAAFACSDVKELVQIAKSYLPECKCLDAVRIVEEAYAAGLDWKECRHKLAEKYPGTFGCSFVSPDAIQDGLPIAPPGMDAPNSVGVITLALLYGDGDFAKSICTAVNCGEDTDCTAASVGATFGIMRGYDALPNEWLEPLGGIINTCCIDLNSTIVVPKTVEELKVRVMRAMPSFLPASMLDLDTYELTAADKLTCEPETYYIKHIIAHKKPKQITIPSLLKLSPYAVRYEYENIGVILDYVEEPFITEGATREIKLSVWDNNERTVGGQWVDVKIYADDGITLPKGKFASMPLLNTYASHMQLTIPITFEKVSSAQPEVVFSISVRGRSTHAIVKATFYPSDFEIV